MKAVVQGQPIFLTSAVPPTSQTPGPSIKGHLRSKSLIDMARDIDQRGCGVAVFQIQRRFMLISISPSPKDTGLKSPKKTRACEPLEENGAGKQQHVTVPLPLSSSLSNPTRMILAARDPHAVLYCIPFCSMSNTHSNAKYRPSFSS